MADLNKTIDQLSDAELVALMNNLTTKPVEDTKVDVKPVSVQVSGQTVEAATAEELNKLLVARLEGLQNAPKPEPTPQTPQTKPVFNHEEFAKLFVADAAKGIDYYDQKTLGISTRQLLPALATGLAQMQTRINELESQQFVTRNSDKYDVSDKKALDEVLAARGWQPSAQSYEDALAIAVSKGTIKVKQSNQSQQSTTETSRTFIPPRTKGAATEDGNKEAELIAASRTMPIEKLEELLRANGILNTSHIS